MPIFTASDLTAVEDLTALIVALTGLIPAITALILAIRAHTRSSSAIGTAREARKIAVDAANGSLAATTHGEQQQHPPNA